MQIRLFGPLEARGAAGPLTFGSVKERAVLAMLALRPNAVVSTDFLVDGLWGDQAPASAVNAVQVYVSRLRKALRGAGGPDGEGGPTVQRRRPGYVLELDPEEVDLHRFQRLIRDGARAMPAAPDRAAATLREALALWRGSPLSEFADEPFARAEIARLVQQRLGAVQTCLEAELALGRHAELVSELQVLLAEHPLHEGLHRLLVLSLYRSGRQGEALEAYSRARRILAEELGVDPGPALRELEGAVLAHSRSLDWTPPGTAPARVPPAGTAPGREPPPGTGAARPHAWNVPPRNPRFTGRDDLLAELRGRFVAGAAGPAGPLVHALHGMGGVGKTQLAIEYAHRFAPEFELVWWLDAEQPVLIPEQLGRLAARLGSAPAATAVEAVDAVLAELRDRDRWLLIFDNARHPRDVVRYLPGGSGQVLITSRSPGWGDLGGRLSVDVPPRAETIALLQARIPGLPDGLADELAAEVGDLPLAAAQAAGYLEQTDLPAADYLHRFRSRRESLLGRGEVLGYHGRLDTTWTLSLDRLSREDPAAVQLLRLAAFLAPEPVPLLLFGDHAELLGEPLRSVAADPDALADAVGSLIGYSLARRHPDGFQMHRLIQAVVRHHGGAEPGATDPRQVVARLLRAAAPGEVVRDPARWPAWLRLLPHVLALTDPTEPLEGIEDDAWWLLQQAAPYLQTRGELHAAHPLFERAHALALRRHGPDHPDTLASAHALARSLFVLGDAVAARDLSQDTLDRRRRLLGPDDPDTLAAANRLARCLCVLGDPAAALALDQDALDRCRRSLGDDHPGTVAAAHHVSADLRALGDHAAARQLDRETFLRCRRLLGDDHPDTLASANLLAVDLNALGRYAAARELAQDTLTRCRRLLGEDHQDGLRAASSLATALAGLGEHAAARRLHEELLGRFRRVVGDGHPDSLDIADRLVADLRSLGEHAAAGELQGWIDAHEARTTGAGIFRPATP